MMNVSNTIPLVPLKVPRAQWGPIHWQFVARLNEKFFRPAALAVADRAGITRQCCELGKMEIEDLIRKYQETGDTSFMGELYRRYAHLVLGTCIKYLKDEIRAQDAVSDIFTKLVVKLRSFFPGYFPGWLYKVSRNHCLEILRKDKSQPHFESYDHLQDIDMPSEPETPDYLHRENVARELGAALKALPERQRISIELFFLQGLSYKQVSETTGYTMNEVKSYVQNGKRNLRNLLNEVAAAYGWKKIV